MKESPRQYLLIHLPLVLLLTAAGWYQAAHGPPNDQQRLLGELRGRATAARAHEADPPVANASLAGANRPTVHPRDFGNASLAALLARLCDAHYPVLEHLSRSHWQELCRLAVQLDQGSWSRREPSLPSPVTRILGTQPLETNDGLDCRELAQLLDQLELLLLPPVPGVPSPQ
jgi:hypothetical protein